MTPKNEYCNRLRMVRKQQNLTLRQVEEKSKGVWKAVVVGSYERGSRALNISKAEELCRFYGVPVTALFVEPRAKEDKAVLNPNCLQLDLRRIREIAIDVDVFSEQVLRFLETIILKRQDWNGEVISLRNSDLNLLSILTGKSDESVISALKYRQMLLHR